MLAEKGDSSFGMRVEGLPLIDTYSDISKVGNLVSRGVAGTVRDMEDWRGFWVKKIAPRLKARKDELGRNHPERTIAFDVQMATGQESSRSLLAMWFRGEREPTLSQFMALCDRMGLDPLEVITGRTFINPDKASTSAPGRKFLNNHAIPHSKPVAKKIKKSKQ